MLLSWQFYQVVPTISRKGELRKRHEGSSRWTTTPSLSTLCRLWQQLPLHRSTSQTTRGQQHTSSRPARWCFIAPPIFQNLLRLKFHTNFCEFLSKPEHISTYLAAPLLIGGGTAGSTDPTDCYTIISGRNEQRSCVSCNRL